jgi:hypothetical protein
MLFCLMMPQGPIGAVECNVGDATARQRLPLTNARE